MNNHLEANLLEAKLSAIHSFGRIEESRWIVAGDKSGHLIIVDAMSFQIISVDKVHSGCVSSIHICGNHFASMAHDNTVAYGSVSAEGVLEIHECLNTRYYRSTDYEDVYCLTQAICITDNHLVTVTSNMEVICFAIQQGLEKQWSRLVSDTDTIITVCIEGNRLMCGTNLGAIHILDLASSETVEVIDFEEIDETIHWIEPIAEQRYLVATDARCLVDLNTADMSKTVISRQFAKDDFEHLTVCQRTGRIFASSFDRNIYEIDQDDINRIELFATTQFKVRWLDVVYDESGKAAVIAQIRDGSLIKIDDATREVTGVIKTTPATIWSGCIMNDNRIVYAGEGTQAVSADIDHGSVLATISHEHIVQGYVKRMASIPQGQNVLYVTARTDGAVDYFQLNAEGEPLEPAQRLIQLESACRDICLFNRQSRILAAVALENGYVHIVDVESQSIIVSIEGDEPVWSLGVSPDHQLLACAQRRGYARVFETTEFTELISCVSSLPKRLKWYSNEGFYLTSSATVDRVSFDSEQWSHERPFIEANNNTVEDFDWDDLKRYIVTIDYNETITLYDSLGEPLDSVYGDTDVMKGIQFLHGDRRDQFVTYGRKGALKLFEIHNEQINFVETLYAPQTTSLLGECGARVGYPADVLHFPSK